MMKWLENHPRRDAILIAVNVVGALFNLGWVLAFPDSYFAWLNWMACGGCLSLAASQPLINKLRRVIDHQDATIAASNAALDAVSPEYMRRMMQGALGAVVEQLKREGKLPPDAEVTVEQDNWPKSLH